jgi:hypothetical protein
MTCTANWRPGDGASAFLGPLHRFIAVPKAAGGEKYQPAMLRMAKKFNRQLDPGLLNADSLLPQAVLSGTGAFLLARSEAYRLAR